MSLSQLIRSIFLTSEVLDEHIHSEQLVAPWGAAPVLLTSGGGAWTFGAYSNDIIALNAVTSLFDLHWAVLTGASANGDFEIEIVYGAADTVACHVAFSRTNAFTASITLPIMTIRLPANSRVRARMRDSVGAATCSIKVLYHTY